MEQWNDGILGPVVFDLGEKYFIENVYHRFLRISKRYLSKRKAIGASLRLTFHV
jgi:hypothetical protein